MDRLQIVVDEKSVGDSLCPLNVGKGSSLSCDILGVSRSISDLWVYFGRIDASGHFAIQASVSGNGRWRLYANGFVFPEVGDTQYHIIGTDESGNSVWLGAGRLRVYNSVLIPPNIDMPIVPEDTYLRNPETGLWHRLVVRVEDGLLVPEIEEEGVER